MLNEVSASGGFGSNAGGTVVPYIKLAYTGGVSVGDYFQTGVTIGFIPVIASTELMVRGTVPFGNAARTGAWLSASGGAAFGLTSSSETIPLMSVAAGIFFRFKGGQRLYVGPSYVRTRQWDSGHREKAWGTHLALTAGFQF